MTTPNKRRLAMDESTTPKRVKKECSYGESCFRRNPAHFREFSHHHLESIIDFQIGHEEYTIPAKFVLQKQMILEQIEVIVTNQLHVPKNKVREIKSEKNEDNNVLQEKEKIANAKPSTSFSNENGPISNKISRDKEINVIKKEETDGTKDTKALNCGSDDKAHGASKDSNKSTNIKVEESASSNLQNKAKDTEYRPIVPPTRRIESFFKVVAKPGGMAAKHAASAPYHIFYTTITDSRETHSQPFSITFQEILDPSLGELQSSLQINFMVDAGWLLAHYYFAGYSKKKLTILYGEDMPDLKDISKKQPQVQAHHVTMPTPFGKHHTKMMLLCYEDGSLRVVVSTANLYLDDWENRTQGLWFSPSCPELPTDAMPHDGESPTMFKRSLLQYLNHYRSPLLSPYVERVKRCDFSHINVFLVASVPGSHFDLEWGMARAGTLLRQHCKVPAAATRTWPLIAQASSIGSYGAQAKLWLTGDFLHHFTKISEPLKTLTQPPELKLIYPSLENVRQSHDGLLGGGCLPYAADCHSRQPWLTTYLFQWKATHTKRDKAMPHIKSYTRLSPCGTKAAYYLLTSGNVSKAAWGTINKGNAALRIMSYEAGVLFLPKFVINKDFFSLDKADEDHLLIPYDLPPTKYTEDMSPWVSDYLH